MKWMKRVGRPLAGFCLLALLATCLNGCTTFANWFSEEDKFFEVNPNHSVNVAWVEDDWPQDFEKLAPLEKEAYQEYGRPPMVHLWWHRQNPIVTEAYVFRLKTAHKKDFKPRKVSWLYPEENREIFFDKRTVLDIKEISDKMKIIAENGDPDTIKYGKRLERRTEKWIYYGLGKMYEFLEDDLIEVDEHSFTPIPNYGGR
ncbi:MAG: hypothetical protein ACOC54_04125 [Candidatus Sumerlaeota bacterium]